MLKPKRKISKQEIKKDPFLEFINDSQKWFQENKKLIYKVAIGLVAIVVVVFFLSNQRGSSAQESQTLLGKALLAQDIGDSENAKFQLQSLVDDYDGTKSGIHARYYLGKMAFDEGDLDVAHAHLSNYTKDGKNALLMTTAYKLLAEIDLKKNNGEKSEELLRKGLKSAKNTVYYNEMSLALAKQLLMSGKTNNAKDIVNQILEQDNLLFTIRKTAEELLAKIISQEVG